MIEICRTGPLASQAVTLLTELPRPVKYTWYLLFIIDNYTWHLLYHVKTIEAVLVTSWYIFCLPFLYDGWDNCHCGVLLCVIKLYCKTKTAIKCLDL